MTVRIEQYASPMGEDVSAPPLPLNHGFRENAHYEVHGWVMEGSELRAILVNDEGQVWAIANRHIRATLGGKPSFVSSQLWDQMKEAE
jgi:hypothetical protein